MTTRLTKTLHALGVVAVLLTVTVGRAATPSFDSFDTNYFRVVKATAPWKILSNTANTTNNFTNVVVNYINSTIINTNTIITNVNSTIVNTNTTIINQGDTIINTNTTIYITTNIFIVNGDTNLAGLWTDVLGDYQPTQADQSTLHATNIVGVQSLTADGAFLMPFSFIDQVLPGTNDLNPYQLGTMRIQSDVNTTNADDRIIRLNAGNGNGHVLFLENYTNGVITQSAFSLLNGTTNWDNSGTVSLVNGDWKPTRAGETIWLQNDGIGWREITRFFGAAGGQGVELWTNNAGILEPVDLTLPLMITNQIRFGLGSTNVLYRLGADLYSTNSGADTRFIQLNGSGNGVELEAQGASGFLSGAGLTTTVGLRVGTDQFVMTGGTVHPVTDLGEGFGRQGNSWLDQWSSNVFVRGYTRAVTNYSWLRIHYPNGTNGPVVFDSQSAGDAGAPRSFLFAANGATNLTISSTSGWTGTGTNVFLDDGTFGPVPSTNGANMSGTLTAPYYPRASAPHTLVNGALWEPFAGAIAIGTNSNTIFPAGAYTGMVATHDTAAGEDQELDMFFAATGDGNVHDITTSTNGSSMFWDGISGTGGESVLQLDRRWADIDSRIGLALLDYGVTNSSPLFQSLLLGTGTGSIPDKLPMWMDPLQYGTSSGTYGDEAIYKFGTASAETHRKLMDVSNAGTNLFSIAASGDAILHGHTPASSSETNYVGAITWDANNLYIWTATNVNKKVPLTSW